MRPRLIQYRKPRKAEEDGLHLFVADCLRRFCRPGVVWWHTPNGGKRSKASAARLKKMGVRAGVPDFIFIDKPGVSFLELKSSVGVLSKEQRRFRDDVEGLAGFAVASTPEEAVNYLLGWGVLTRDPLRRVEGIAA